MSTSHQWGLKEIDKLLPTVWKNRQIDELVAKLQDLYSVTQELQKEDLTVSDVRNLFDSVMVELPFTADCILANEEIVLHPNFE